MSKFVNQEIEPEHVWISISEGKMVRGVILLSINTDHYNTNMGVYRLDNESVSSVKNMVKLAKEGENIRFYILEEVKEDNNDVTG